MGDVGFWVREGRRTRIGGWPGQFEAGGGGGWLDGEADAAYGVVDERVVACEGRGAENMVAV